MDNRPTLTKTKVKTSTKVGLVLGAGIIAVAAFAVVLKQPPTVSIIKLPDLVPVLTSITVQKDGSIDYKIVIRNNGAAIAGPSKVGIYIIKGGKKTVMSPLDVESIAPGSISKELSAGMTSNVSSGATQLVVTADVNNQVVESDENNERSAPLLPDVVPTSITPNNITGITSITVSNQGVMIVGPFDVKLEAFSANGTTPIASGNASFTYGILPQSSVQFPVYMYIGASSVPGYPANMATLKLTVDPGNKILESTEGNNVLIWNIK